MGYAVRYISQVYNTDTGVVIREDEVYSKVVKYPDSIDELGLRHREQIEVINARQKNKKMQWSRDGAHNLIQIRTSIYSKTWGKDWEMVKNRIYKNAA